ncbi:hypothetical protein [Methylobacterium persicinum]|uniref:Uncharacterized protein n=1 Tax=Methylobacterium persicinum TaxID=374426 RepID=A0ABU0HSB3_9HYPH|nr:hypothetical protein [Methylobacterium persicinum]MDQ0445234.1 hypothetical protein [Methylobacterium persicinum]GJE37859.1 hypothetical protein KHHGKMAE_1921 [Methylobacterium persicinum]
MKWFLSGVLICGLALMAWGNSISNGPGSADERIAGAIPVLLGAGFIALDVVVAFVWLIFRA